MNNKNHEKIQTQVKERYNTTQDWKTEIEAARKTQTEAILNVENPGKRPATTGRTSQTEIKNGKENLKYRRYQGINCYIVQRK